ncbi:hypothetical protein [Pyrinomonas methylaliphatogenes]|jgi:hypothetical protein|uniref:hypothetical protein n=1 Tax=Pyrinomonas methylaliphatogenes TaxID=454194 RepID=UPI0005A8FCD2|nr:hypothetical protein [Pyrinomonas methylaliphatogenes]MBX5480197.1 hypothetical protein [Pyrinomonas methylaliphatogenes]
MNWQNALATFTVLAALIYLVRRALDHLRTNKTGCSGCDAATSRPKSTLVKITRANKRHPS